MTLEGFIFGVGWLNLLLAILVIFLRRDKDPNATLMWFMITMFMPGIGFILYLFLGHDYRKSEMFDIKLKEDKIINRAVKRQVEIISNNEFEEGHHGLDEYNDFINLNLKSDQSVFTKDNEVEAFFWGEEKFKALLKDFTEAKHSIDILYFIFKPDGIGTQILEVLEEKARQGVEVRLLVDAVGGRRLTKKKLKGLRDAGGKVYKFFPGFLKIFNFRLNYRNHRKICIIDDNIGYIGGFNVGDDYLGKYENKGPWRDTHLRIVGSSVADLKVRFLKDWAYASNNDIDLEVRNIDFSLQGKGDTGVQIVTSGPDTEYENIKNAIAKMITEAQHEIIIQSPYFVPDQTIMDLLTIQIASGVRVKIMIPGNPDHPFVFPAAMFYLGRLANKGAEVYLYRYGFIHTKTILVDDDLSTVGSANMDNRSFRLNFESNAIMYSKEVNKKLKDQFYEDVKNSSLMTYEDYEKRPLSLKIKESISKLLSPIL